MQRLYPPEVVKILFDPLVKKGVNLVDVRETWEYEVCHLEQAIHIPLSTLPVRLGELNPDNTTVVYCHHGMRSLQAAHFLERNGFTDVINLEGGIDAWASEIDPVMARY
jgi:rhodanese-related sulfurtransferase